MKIIMDSLVPNHRKKQLMPDSTMEPPAGSSTPWTSHVRPGLGSTSNTQLSNKRLRPTQHAEPSYFVHEEGRDDVSGQNSQCSQEVDKVDPVGAVVIVEGHLTARLVVVEGAVDHSRVCQLGVIDICKCVGEDFFIWTDPAGKMGITLHV